MTSRAPASSDYKYPMKSSPLIVSPGPPPGWTLLPPVSEAHQQNSLGGRWGWGGGEWVGGWGVGRKAT